MVDTFEPGRWYWDRRTNKALYPRRIDDETVEFVSVWHADEVADAVGSGAVVPVDDIAPDEADSPLDCIDSFRMPDDIGPSSTPKPDTDAARDTSDNDGTGGE